MGFCTFNNATTSPPYTISVESLWLPQCRVPPLPLATDANSIWLLAGDLNDDDVVNILDIQLMASLLNSPVITTSTLSAAADYTGAGFAPDDVINIIGPGSDCQELRRRRSQRRDTCLMEEVFRSRVVTDRKKIMKQALKGE
jgi:hypothetical protein